MWTQRYLLKEGKGKLNLLTNTIGLCFLWEERGYWYFTWTASIVILGFRIMHYLTVEMLTILRISWYSSEAWVLSVWFRCSLLFHEVLTFRTVKMWRAVCFSVLDESWLSTVRWISSKKIIKIRLFFLLDNLGYSILTRQSF